MNCVRHFLPGVVVKVLAGINHLPLDELSTFIVAFAKKYA